VSSLSSSVAIANHVTDARYQRGYQREQRRDIHFRDDEPSPTAAPNEVLRHATGECPPLLLPEAEL